VRVSQTPGTGGNLEVWSKPLGQGSSSNAVALFNRSSQPAQISFTQEQIGLGPHPLIWVRDAWNRKDAGIFNGYFEATVEPYATAVYVLSGIALELQISTVSGQAIISWPTNAAGFDLQARDSLSPDFTWDKISTTPVVIGNEFVVTNNLGQCSRFFRLYQK